MGNETKTCQKVCFSDKFMGDHQKRKTKQNKTQRYSSSAAGPHQHGVGAVRQVILYPWQLPEFFILDPFLWTVQEGNHSSFSKWACWEHRWGDHFCKWFCRVNMVCSCSVRWTVVTASGSGEQVFYLEALKLPPLSSLTCCVSFWGFFLSENLMQLRKKTATDQICVRLQWITNFDGIKPGHL